MAKINAEKDTVTAQHYRVSSYPNILVLQPDGTEIDRLVGYFHPAEYQTLVMDYLGGRNTLAALQDSEKTMGDDPAFVWRLGERYFEHGLTDDAKARYLKLAQIDPKNKSGFVDDGLMELAYMNRKAKNYPEDRKYAQMVLDQYPDGDQMKSAFLEIGITYKKENEPAKAQKIFLDYAKKFPTDEDASWAKAQADTMSAWMARKGHA